MRTNGRDRPRGIRAVACEERTGDPGAHMKPTSEPSTQEVLAGLVERVTFHNAENGFCVLRAKARGHRDLVTVVGHAAIISAGEWITAAAQARARWRYAVMIGVRDPPPSAGSPRRWRCSSTRRDRRQGFLRGIGAVELTGPQQIGNTPSNPKPSILQRLRNLTSLSRPLPRDERRAASQTSSLAVARSTPCKIELEIEGQLEFADHNDREIVSLQRDQIAVPEPRP